MPKKLKPCSGPHRFKLIKPVWIKTTDRLPDYETWVLLFLVTNNPENSGVVMGQRSSAHEGQFWDGDMYRPMAWISHWMPLPEPPPKPWTRP